MSSPLLLPTSPPPSVGAAVAKAMKDKRKRRAARNAKTALSLPRNDNGMQELNEFWEKQQEKEEMEDSDYREEENDDDEEEEENDDDSDEEEDEKSTSRRRQHRKKVQPRFSLGHSYGKSSKKTSHRSIDSNKENELNESILSFNASKQQRAKGLLKKIKNKPAKVMTMSPSELSRVSTLPPSPIETPEAVRKAREETEEQEENDHVAITQQKQQEPVMKEEDVVPTSPLEPPLQDESPNINDEERGDDDEDDDDDDADDDLLPPPPPDDDDDNEDDGDEEMLESDGGVNFDEGDDKQQEDEDEMKKPAAQEIPSNKKSKQTPKQDDSEEDDEATIPEDEGNDEEPLIQQTPSRNSFGRVIQDDGEDIYDGDDDEDDDGRGFQMADEPLNPPEIPRRQKKEPPPPVTSDDDYSDEISRRPKKKKRSSEKRVIFSPKGYQTGPRSYEAVPVSDYQETPSPTSEGLRRSKRARFKPLQYWKNERPIYEAHSEVGVLGDAMGCMPVVSGVLTAMPTPYKKRRGGGGPGRRKKETTMAAEVVDGEPFDATALKQKYNFVKGSDAEVWDELNEDASEMKVVSFARQLPGTNLPLPTRLPSESKVVGRAAQSFVYEQADPDSPYIGYLVGNLTLPPTGIKDPETTGSCTQIFTVCSCQPQALEVAFSDPHEEGLLPETAQRFLLSEGDQFRIPPGNAYRLENHSHTTSCRLAWTIIRPRLKQTGSTSSSSPSPSRAQKQRQNKKQRKPQRQDDDDDDEEEEDEVNEVEEDEENDNEREQEQEQEQELN